VSYELEGMKEMFVMQSLSLLTRGFLLICGKTF